MTEQTPEQEVEQTEQTEQTEDEAVEAPENVDESREPAEGEDEPQGDPRNKEAARYRTRLREAEAERDGMRVRLVGYQRAEAARVAADVLEVGDDLFDIGLVDVAQVVDEDGQVDPEKVRNIAAAIAHGRPGLRARQWPSTGQDRGPLRWKGNGFSWSDWLESRGR